MPKQGLSANQIRQSFIDFFVEKHGHSFVPSSSLVPGGDATLLFANSGMVQFKDVFLGTDDRPYTRAVNSQKCLRVAGKHNDLEEVGTDDTHHTFFEMLGNWSFGDYYKKEAIEWAWELLTEVWGLPKERLYATVFKDDSGDISTDDEAAEAWKAQPGFVADHISYWGRKDNFWEMADTGPCGPNSEIHIDLGEDKGEITYLEDGRIDLDGPRFVELWNLVFMQYNRTGPKDSDLKPLPATHVDTGMGFERIVSVLQGVDSNYRTDLFSGIIDKIQALTGHSDNEVAANFTPYRVIADHSRAAAFLIADGVVPGNVGRNYIARMIIRRAARFGGKLGLHEPFLAPVAEVIIEQYGEAYPELEQNCKAILDNLTREEQRFQRTVEAGVNHLEEELAALKKGATLNGETAFDLYATYGLPLEISRDIAKERGLDVDDAGFQAAMEAHREASGGGQAMGALGGEDVEVYRELIAELKKSKKLSKDGVEYDPYSGLEAEGEVLALVRDGQVVDSAKAGDQVAVLLPRTNFYVASGGQISDTGEIRSQNGKGWRVQVNDTVQPAAGAIVHLGEVVEGNPKVGDAAVAAVAHQRRQDIMRNHTATHLLHAALHQVLGEHARQAGSLVAPDRLRFDFNHPEGMSSEQIRAVEDLVNGWALDNYALKIEYKSLEQAKKDGAIALFGEKYGEEVRTIQIGDDAPFSYELCGGTHLESTGDIGVFLITSEGSAAAGIRRIEAVTGREAYTLLQKRNQALRITANKLKISEEDVPSRVAALEEELANLEKQISKLKTQRAGDIVEQVFENAKSISGVTVLTEIFEGADREFLGGTADQFRMKHPDSSVIVASSGVKGGTIVAAITRDLVDAGLSASELIKFVAEPLGGKGGGRPDFAQASVNDPSHFSEAFKRVEDWVETNVKKKK